MTSIWHTDNCFLLQKNNLMSRTCCVNVYTCNDNTRKISVIYIFSVIEDGIFFFLQPRFKKKMRRKKKLLQCTSYVLVHFNFLCNVQINLSLLCPLMEGPRCSVERVLSWNWRKRKSHWDCSILINFVRVIQRISEFKIFSY